MRLFREIRNAPTWLRAALAALVLGFAVNTVAHAGHAHDPASVFSQHTSCEHCVQFGHLADAPSYAHEAPVATRSFRLALPEGDVVDSRTIWLSAKPRGPPLSESL
jgi:hypothetical protein